jgi:glycosyltransferase involved in cell wall biosynthesis
VITIAHLLDDGALGGVTRFLDALVQRMGPAFQHQRHIVSPHLSLPGPIKADAIVVHFAASWAKLPFLSLLRARASNTPIIIVEHGYSEAFETLHVRAPRRFRTMLRGAYALADRVIAVSYGQARWMRAAMALPASKLRVIQPFTNSMALTSITPPNVGDGPLRLGAFGRYCAQKDFATLVSAMRLVDPAVASLSIRGFGPDVDTLRAQAESLPHVTVGDAIVDLGDFLSETDAVVVPSAFEAFGQVALEARLAARPLIVTDVDGLPEQINSAFGIIVPPSAPRDMAAAIEALAIAHQSPDWNAMCNASRASATGHVAASVARWQQLILDVCSHQPTKFPAKPALASA